MPSSSYTQSVQFSLTVMSDSLRPHGLQHTRLPYLSPTPGAYPNSYPSSRWCHSTISFSVVPSAPALILSLLRAFSNESVLHIRWPKYWSFSFDISPSNEYSGLISFRIDWFDLLAFQGTLKSLHQHHSWKASILWHSAFLCDSWTIRKLSAKELMLSSHGAVKDSWESLGLKGGQTNQS